jgi:hypothetical protein
LAFTIMGRCGTPRGGSVSLWCIGLRVHRTSWHRRGSARSRATAMVAAHWSDEQLEVALV